jgi:hypothetical protein
MVEQELVRQMGVLAEAGWDAKRMAAPDRRCARKEL